MKQQKQMKPSASIVVAVTAAIIMLIGIAFSVARLVAPSDSTNPPADDAASDSQELPLPEVSEGLRGTFGIDKNINESTIDRYLNREDSVYRDMRMLKDPANYEAIDGDSYLSGFVRGFEAVPYPYIINVNGLPAEVGETYKGETLFTQDADGNVKANYRESMQILEDLFPKNKNIFLMCGGGGYAGMMKDLLIKLGWDKDKIYNVGGYWYYEGDNNVKVKNELDGETVYSFWKVPYHEINFADLHEKKS